MTKENKQNCLNLRYAFKDDFDDLRGKPQDVRYDAWVIYVDKSSLSAYEKQLCKDEFIPSLEDAKKMYGK